MSEEYFNHFLKEIRVSKQFSSYIQLGNSVLVENRFVDDFECKDEETAERLTEHLRKLEHMRFNTGMLASYCQLNHLTDDEYHKLKSIIYNDEEKGIMPLVSIVEHFNGVEFLRENETNYLLPIASIEAMCIFINYVAVHGTVPDVTVNNWWEREEFKEYLNYVKTENP